MEPELFNARLFTQGTKRPRQVVRIEPVPAFLVGLESIHSHSLYLFSSFFCKQELSASN